MCGIHGVLSTSKLSRYNHSKFLEQGFITSGVRGLDSSGMFQVDVAGNAYIHKLAVPGSIFNENKLTKQFLDDAKSSPITVCHVRAATQGKVNADNAHPFEGWSAKDTRIVGVHNGTLNGWHNKEGAKLFTVDSEWAINFIAAHGADAFKEFNGAYAFVWWSENDPTTVFMARNKERPMHLALTGDGESLYFASERGMLAWLMERNGIALKDDKLFELGEDQLYRFDLSEEKISWTKTDIPKKVYYPTTTHNATTPYASGGNNFPASTSYNNARGRDDWDYEDAEYGGDWGHSGYRSGGANRRTYQPETPNSFPAYASGIVERFRATVLDVRSERLAQANGRGAKQTEQKKETTSVLAQVEEQAIDSMKEDGVLPELGFLSSGATSEEKQAAKSLGLYGRLEWFSGQTFEPEVSELFGKVEEFVPSTKSKRELGAILRGTTAARADRQFVNNEMKGGWVAVIGVSPTMNKDGTRDYIVGELTDLGRKALVKAAA